jgi:DNA-binding response OmpR family regulator
VSTTSVDITVKRRWRIALRLRLDVVLVDMGLPRLTGIEVIRRVKTALPGVRLLALTVMMKVNT